MKKFLFIWVYSLLLSPTLLLAQAQLKGQVIDGLTQEPLMGATILVKETGKGAYADSAGQFTLNGNQLQDLPVHLLVSYYGYERLEYLVSSLDAIVLNLVPESNSLAEVVVTARRRNEVLQSVPLPVAVIGASKIDQNVAFNVNRIKEYVPSVQLYSSNPRNTTLNIRGLGSTFGLTNDGIDPGVGFYVDGVYFARPAATSLDFVDVQQIEVIRGPQGTLYGKNTTAGTFNITTRKPSFVHTQTFEQSFGNYGFIQTKAAVSGPLVGEKLAFRLSTTATFRDGVLYNVRTQKDENTLNNQGIRGQLLFVPAKNIDITLAGDYNRQRPDGYAAVYAGFTRTQRADFRQFEQIISDLNYQVPGTNPFDRLIDTDTPWQSDQDMGGVSLQANFDIGKGVLTSTSAWRTWHWDPSNDRDFLGLQALKRSQAPSVHNQWSQELRYAGEFSSKVSGTAGLFAFYQDLQPKGAHIEEAGSDQWRFVQNNQNPLWQTPGLLDGYGIRTIPAFQNLSAAAFGQIDWKITSWLTVLPGFRVNYDDKAVQFSRTTFGGLATEDPALLALKRAVYSNLAFEADIEDINYSGQITLQSQLHKQVNTFATYSIGFKPVGLNLGGIPTANGEPDLSLAVVKPERVNHLEWGLKTSPIRNSILNLTVFNTEIQDYQTNVQVADLAVNRGYLANAERVRVRGAELELAYQPASGLSLNGSLSLTDGRYLSFKNAPVPLEETGGVSFKDISGEQLPGISRWAGSVGAEWSTSGKLMGSAGDYFVGVDAFFRSTFSSNPSASAVLNVPGYALFNTSIGFRAQKGISLFLWSRNLTDTNYFEQLLPAAGNTGHYAGVLGDPRTFGFTVRFHNFQ